MTGNVSSAGPGPVTRLIRQAAAGDRAAEAELLRLLYLDLHRIAQRHMRNERSQHTLQPTALVNEAFIRMMRGSQICWTDQAHFLATASTVMRRVLVDHARRRDAAKRGTPVQDVDLGRFPALESVHSAERILAVDEALVGLATLDARRARIVEMRFFGGLGNEEIAAVLGISARTVKREWALAKTWLYRRLSSGR